MLKLINASRVNNGLSKLKLNTRLSTEAKDHSTDMAASGQLFHSANLADLMHWPWSKAAENIGCGESVHVVHNAFMASAEHKGNILDPDFRRVGIGVVPGTGSGCCGAGGVWETEDFYG